jgi:metal-responsive CopG/Arc/MetJ family transcriptional regulator
MSKNKVNICISLDQDLLDWIEKEKEKRSLDGTSQTIRVLLREFKGKQ